MISNKQIALKIIDACKNNVDINAFTQSIYDKNLTYIRGLDIENDSFSENGDEFLPCVIIDPVEKLDGNVRKYEYEIVLYTFIFKKEKPIKVDDVVTYDGIDEVENLNDLIIKSIQDNAFLGTGLDMEDITSHQKPVEGTSIYRGFIVIGFSKVQTIGGDGCGS